jgi:uncharacterized membrane protein
VHYRAYTAPSAESFCSVGATLDCASVALSRYSVLGGVPVPLWGCAGFLALLGSAWLRSRWLLPLAAVASLASLAFLGLQLFAIGAICLLCEGVHVASWLLLALGGNASSSPIAIAIAKACCSCSPPRLGLL